MNPYATTNLEGTERRGSMFWPLMFGAQLVLCAVESLACGIGTGIYAAKGCLWVAGLGALGVIAAVGGAGFAFHNTVRSYREIAGPREFNP